MNKYAVVSVYHNKDRIVHCYGVYDTRREAVNASRRLKTRTIRSARDQYKESELPYITYHVCEVMDDDYIKRANANDS